MEKHELLDALRDFIVQGIDPITLEVLGITYSDDILEQWTSQRVLLANRRIVQEISLAITEGYESGMFVLPITYSSIHRSDLSYAPGDVTLKIEESSKGHTVVYWDRSYLRQAINKLMAGGATAQQLRDMLDTIDGQ